ncbi:MULTISPECIES: hypothetical protein [unclassified Streptomyces]|uniref:hypothetical protein n=1 Tax=unclassified Streptomyces TaxID=2593676 RepID=UPI00114CB65F|nr:MULTISPECIES: hypothetical protein [unclassified Streptomyces]MYS19850.1 hypothetical protein [Streptomyces sp. SID4948]
MNRWLVRRFVRIRTGMAEFGRDRGQTGIEYLGIAVVIAVIIGVLATTDIGNAILTAILSKISQIAGD